MGQVRILIQILNPSTSGVNYTLNDASRIMFGDFPADSGYPESAGGGTVNLTRSANGNNRQRINQGLSNLGTGSSPSNWTGTNLLRAINRTTSTNVEMFVDTTQSSGTQTSILRSKLQSTIISRKWFIFIIK
jgi:hypothetical protein